ncbi:ABC transporter permease [Thalassoglobus polymorphus]|uniref:ABC transporter permease YtrF n=1 Tax=Thalassoglobus polymorphus TaxID=2527994 RepID=A0A517QM84_9PLAN|nr:ABC transporter permease [Thalassoglobus polymorphus]QDT32749.1 ABC transporter permease YtrF precursor [Thalassoglobus polymorphus]
MFRFAMRNLLSRPLRTALSVLGLAVAISGMVGLFSIAGGIDRVVSQTFDQIPGLLVQQKGAPIPLFSTLPASWQDELESIPGVGVVDPEVFCRVNQLDTKMVINPPRFAVGMEIQSRLKLKRSIYRENLVEGRFFEMADRSTNHCLVSSEISTSSQKGVGETITLNGVEFEIIGVYETGSLMLDVNILMDIATCRSLGRIDEQTVGCFYVEPDGTIDDITLKESIQNHFRGRDLSDWKPASANVLSEFVKSVGQSFQSPAGKNVAKRESSSKIKSAAEITASTSSPIEVRTADDWGKRIAEFSGDLNIFLGLMTAIGVSIATLSIVNTMMMSVTERTTEFGILRANGWSQQNIIRLMTLESGLIGFCGGAIGVFVGWLATILVNIGWPGRLQLHAGVLLLLFGLAFSVGLGLIGGLYPAWRASRLSPMESIRRG